MLFLFIFDDLSSCSDLKSSDFSYGSMIPNELKKSYYLTWLAAFVLAALASALDFLQVRYFLQKGPDCFEVFICQGFENQSRHTDRSGFDRNTRHRCGHPRARFGESL
jgi:hypothetical protein